MSIAHATGPTHTPLLTETIGARLDATAPRGPSDVEAIAQQYDQDDTEAALLIMRMQVCRERGGHRWNWPDVKAFGVHMANSP